ncbi:hypothetical protein [Phycicoccus ginsengisoli]
MPSNGIRAFAWRSRRFWEKQGWRPTGRTSRTLYPPHPVLLEYGRELRR